MDEEEEGAEEAAAAVVVAAMEKEDEEAVGVYAVSYSVQLVAGAGVAALTMVLCCYSAAGGC